MTKSKSVDLKKLITFSEGAILSKVIAEGEEAETTLFCMAKGTSLSEHTSGREAKILVLEGKGTFNFSGKEVALSGKEVSLLPGVFIFMPKRTRHSLKAQDDLAFLLILS